MSAMGISSKTINWLIDSSYRNRVRYPDPGYFILDVNSVNQPPGVTTSVTYSGTTPTTTMTVSNAADPVLDGFAYDANAFDANANLTTPLFYLNTTSKQIYNFYFGSYLCVPFADNSGEYWSLITKYEFLPVSAPTSFEATCADPWTGGPYPSVNQPSTDYYISFEKPLKVSNTANNEYRVALTSASTSFYEITFTCLDDPSFYIGKYAYIQSPVPGFDPYGIFFSDKYQWAMIKKVLSFNSGTRIATFELVDPLYAPVTSTTKTLLTAGTYIRILKFNYDNSRALKLQATSVFNNPNCTSANLSISIPAAPILTGYHGFLSDYPYVLVSIQNAVFKYNSQNLISNVPETEQVTFAIPVQYLSAASAAQQKHFVLNAIFGGNNVLMNIRDSLVIKVLLPNGEPIDFDWASLGVHTYFNGLGYPIPSDPFANIQLFLSVTIASPSNTPP